MTDFGTNPSTPAQALAYLQREQPVSPDAFAAIMQLHVLNLPDLDKTLRPNFEREEWTHLSGQLQAFANMRHETLLDLAFTIRLLEALANVAGAMNRRPNGQ